MAKIQLYDNAELEFLNKIKEKNDKMEIFFEDNIKKWDAEIAPLYDTIKCDFKLDNAKKIMEVQVNALAYRQNISEQISMFLNKRSIENTKLKKATQEKIMWYAIGESPLGLGKKLSPSQLTSVIEAHVSELQRSVEIIDVHVDYLRSIQKMLSDMAYAIKNIIELYNYLSKN